MMESMQGLRRTHRCGLLRSGHTGREVVLMGWVQSCRDHGGLIFLDLRDRSGIVQVVFNPGQAKAAFQKAEKVRSEYVLAITGRVEKRPEGTENLNLATGQVEVIATQIRILNEAKTPPFYIEDGVEVDENITLKYRYLDLRRPEMQRILELKHRAARVARNFLDRHDFLEIETPMLTRSTPEGARDFLIPSRLNPGCFYALPQSPQLFKQILMVAGIDRYFQIVRCFRDEDLRADRQPEFTQIDIEMSFVDVDDILELMEEMIVHLCRETAGISINQPFPRFSYQEVMDRFGTDKPDIRFGLELVDLTDLAGACDFKVFANAVASGGQVKGINARGCGGFSRREIEELTALAAVYKANGLAYITVTPQGAKSPITKFFSEREIDTLLERLEAREGDLLLFVAGQPAVVANALSALRLHLAEFLGLIPRECLQFVWVVDFPLLEYDEEEKRFAARHHPFTSPREEDLLLLKSDPAAVRAKAYDLVLNGVEMGGGSIRIHRRNVQEEMFAAIGLSLQEARDKFGFLLEAFEYGTPPHGGIAFGFDRLVMLLAGKKTIRDVMAFPKTQSAADLMCGAPDKVSPEQLRELRIKLDLK
ncbi:MAG TPA: aspartate--tRNA ligase [Desulfotomaculum sp.]|nr:aspartate--tRNA ligase [Desulfotomaculum sp.]